MSGPRQSLARARVRGASLVEYMIVLGAIALCAAGAFSLFGGDVRSLLGWEGDCVRTFQCEGQGIGGDGAGSPPVGSSRDADTIFAEVQAAFAELDDPASPPTGQRARELEAFITHAANTLADREMAAWRSGADVEATMRLSQQAMDAAGFARRARERAFQVRAAENSVAGDVVRGFFVDGAWGTVVGLYNVVRHPIQTAEGIGTAIAHPIRTYEAVRDGLAQRWEENPSRLVGAGIFEVVSLVVAPTKVARVSRVAEEARVLSDARIAVNVVEATCPGGVCARPSIITTGAEVLVPRTDGTISAGRVVQDLGDGRLVVEVMTADGRVGTKIVDRSQLTARLPTLDPRVLLADDLATLPAADRVTLSQAGTRIDIGRGSVADALGLPPDARPRGYPPGSTYRDVHAVYSPGDNRIILSVDEQGRVLPGGSINVFHHEAAHALDRALGNPSQTQAFIDARAADLARSPGGRLSDPYYAAAGERAGGNQASIQAALSETYAEGYALYLNDKTYMQTHYPSLYQYFETQSARPVPPPR